MESPSISSVHLKELEQKFPYVFYVWNRNRCCYEVWCDERRGIPPYKFMDCVGPNGEYREPGEWVLNRLRETDPDTGEYQVGTKAGRKAWIQSLEDRAYLERRRRSVHERHMREIRDAARFVNRHGRNVCMDPSIEPKSRHLKKGLAG